MSSEGDYGMEERKQIESEEEEDENETFFDCLDDHKGVEIL